MEIEEKKFDEKALRTKPLDLQPYHSDTTAFAVQNMNDAIVKAYVNDVASILRQAYVKPTSIIVDIIELKK